MVRLDLSNKKLTEIPLIPEDVSELDLSYNKIEELKKDVFPTGLKRLYLNNNKIKKLNIDCFNPKLNYLNLSDNLIKKLENVIFPSNLNYLNLSANKIEELKKNIFPINLKYLYLNVNQITELSENVFPNNLFNLGLSYNKIVKLKENVFPSNLEELWLNNNQIKELPLHLVNLQRINIFVYQSNLIEFIPLPVQIWLDRINQGLTQNNKVYSDTQNIHNSNIQKSFRQSLENIMKDKLDYSLCKCKEELLTSCISEEVKREVLNYCDDKTEHSIYLITFEDLFHYVMNRILKHSEKDEIFKILDEEIKDTICQCFTGRMTRLLNVLNGFYPDIKIQIGNNEQITNIILMLKEKYENVDVLKEKVKEELEERGYEEGIIEEWSSYIE